MQRALKFVKYLPRFDWEPVVLTADPSGYALRDESLLAELPGQLLIRRTPAPDPYALFSRLSRQDKQHVELASLGMGRSESSFKRLAAALRGTLFIPDARAGWFPFARRAGMDLIKKYQPDVLFSTAPPFTAALVGSALHRRSGIPWVSDYRDPWTDAYFYLKRPRISQLIENRLEKKMLRQASCVLAVNRHILDDLTAKYRFPLPGRRAVIPNGYDPEDFTQISPVVNTRFTIVYTGTINSKMHPGPLLDLLPHLAKKNHGLADAIRFRCIGRIDPDIRHLFERPEIAAQVELIPHLPRRECLRHTAGADVLLLLVPDYENNRLITTNKIFEYMQSGKPVLCLSENSEAAEIVRRTGIGLAVHPEKTGVILDWLTDQIRFRKSRGFNVQHNDLVKQYSRKEQTRQLAALFNRLSRKEK